MRGSRRGTEPRSFNRGESYATAYESFDSAEEERRRQKQQAVAANSISSSSKAAATEERRKKQQQQQEGESSREGPLKLDPTLSRSNTEFTGELSRAEPIPMMMDGGSDSEGGSVPPSVEASNSLASLLKHDELARRKKLKRCDSSRGRPQLVSQPSLRPSILSITRKSSPKKKKVRTASEPPPVARLTHASTNKDRVSGGLVRFNTAVDLRERDKLMQLKLADMSRSRSFRHAGRHYSHVRKREGEIIKMENMLVRVEVTMKKLPNEYDENESMQFETRTAEKWREYVVVCRETGEEETPFSLRLYKSRVIPAIDRPHVSSYGTREIPLDPKLTKVNLYSSLDKTLVLWLPFKQGTIIYIMRPRCYSSSVEWYTFIRNALGWARPDLLQIQVPDLSLSLRIEDPFGKIEEKLRDEPLDDEAPIREEKVVARNLLNQSMEMLEGIKEWADIIEHWKTNERMGLAWRRYDRIEWVHGLNEQRMYGSIAMQRTHQLELRPKTHYPTTTKMPTGEKMVEPPPVEGFLLRLTSSTGRHERLGKLFFKRLYFYTHDSLLCFCKPARALPPPPPKLPVHRGTIPKTSEIIDEIPLIYAVAPYCPGPDGAIPWLSGSAEEIDRRDKDAYDEAERKVNTLLRADGYVDLVKAMEVRLVRRQPQGKDAGVGHGESADFHRSVPDSSREDGVAGEFNDERAFEIVLDNGLVLRLQCFCQRTRDEWVTRLHDLIRYWKARDQDDLAILRKTRNENLRELNIDEEMESIIGQFARKWEVSRSIASAEIFNVCGMSSCRAITISGVLYRKPRKHATFKRYNVVLCHGEMLIFHHTYRSRTGVELPHVHQERHVSLSLRDCYIYSGLITENDLLYQNQTFDSNTPGRHSLPRVYQDGMTSHDEDTMTCFVLWHGMRRSLFKTTDDDGRTVRHRVTQLGAAGKCIVFKARSRLERDAWVMSIGMEIERLNINTSEDIRITAEAPGIFG
ncbi:hypothetical protein P167DRAFT_537550 [Morchella conica CCBAS932]|uniref:PH domain-containing protein n=1 Tax=Morchella conica CCBAS932 TaxID=1392247 RepID=A0A3N4KJ90_9PEZI|nr:hypothetical protein P167DRAFT_537550 [Morchella conica CCBAS932]